MSTYEIARAAGRHRELRTFVLATPMTVDAQISAIRRAHVEAEVVGAGLDHRFVETVDGNMLSAAQRANVDDDPGHRMAAWLTPGRFGCAFSHLQAYEDALAAGVDVAFVVEDDVVLPPNVGDLLTEIAHHMRGREVVLLYWRSWPGCRFSGSDAVPLALGGALMQPVDPASVNCAAAYLVTRAACESLVRSLLPIRAGADAWRHFVDEGMLDTVRCVVPRPAGTRTDFKSTIRLASAGSASRRLSTFVAHHRVFPVHQLLARRRRRLEVEMSTYEIADGGAARPPAGA